MKIFLLPKFCKSAFESSQYVTIYNFAYEIKLRHLLDPVCISSGVKLNQLGT